MVVSGVVLEPGRELEPREESAEPVQALTRAAESMAQVSAEVEVMRMILCSRRAWWRGKRFTRCREVLGGRNYDLPMAKNKTARQKLAVFGQSGSGKTVLMSSFYGPTQEPELMDKSIYEVLTDKSETGRVLHQNYLKMKEDNQTPVQNRFVDTMVKFRIFPRGESSKEQMELEWHDYPGEWFETDPATEEEKDERTQTFKSLVSSDVALFLVDGSKLRANRDEEERYLKALFTNFRRTLESQREGIIGDGPKLEQFPRIWMIGLSKADLLPELDVFAFRDLIVKKAQGEISELARTLKKFIQMDENFSLGEEFVLLSSAKFGETNIDVTKRTGLDLILPLAAFHPMEKFTRWDKYGKIPQTITDKLKAFNQQQFVQVGIQNVLQRVPKIKDSKRAESLLPFLVILTQSAVSEIIKIRDKALEKDQFLRALYSEFAVSLSNAEKDRKLKRSRN